ncbi:MAG: protein kinase [Intestinibacter bartlettii]|uniref:protein kinase domain-containing protein n=1 Tax=Intestinibacter bartlettii TaxID=261299 RepID=UPI0026EE854F|nr:protein kinase [Intestinibacter bartlettii]MDO5010161.1 protein kinase [Intestinibacter bartlettii]
MLVIDNRYQVYNEDNNNLEIDKLYKAKDLQLDSYVYIKVLKDNQNIKDTFIANLVDESMMMGDIDCDNIAKILDVIDEDEYKYYIVSEYFDGVSLFDLVKKSSLNIDNIIYISKQIVSSMKIYDEKDFYHGSIRLDNILVDKDYNVKIYDLGITKANSGVNIRMNNNISFLSPHQINVNYTDKESDFFAIGVVMYYCLFKKMPFKIGKTEFEMLKNIDKGISLDREKITDLNEPLIEIIKKLLERKDKYKSYSEILMDLTEIMYVKADIVENKNIDLEEIEYEKTKRSNSFMIKLVSIIMCIIIIVMIIIQL